MNIFKIVGKEKVIGMLKQSSSQVNENYAKYLEAPYPKRSLKNYLADLQLSMKNELYKNALSIEVVKSNDTAFEMNINKCPWAKTFIDADVAEIGYAGICIGNFSTTKVFNPKMKFTRDKTLMEGADCCHARLKWRGEGN
jgi:hypothetical protein